MCWCGCGEGNTDQEKCWSDQSKMRNGCKYGQITLNMKKICETHCSTVNTNKKEIKLTLMDVFTNTLNSLQEGWNK